MRPYRGEHRDIAKLALGESLLLPVPMSIALKQFAASVSNAVTHLGRTRGMKFKTKLVIHTVGRRRSFVRVTRTHTQDEIQQLGY